MKEMLWSKMLDDALDGDYEDRVQQDLPSADEILLEDGGDDSSDSSEDESSSEDACHCQGHRLLVIIGDSGDPSINAARQWALKQKNVEHRIHYPAAPGNNPRMRAPSVPNANNNDWTPYRPAPMPPGKVRAIASPCMACCYYEEVIVIAHGSQQGLWHALVECLPDIFQGKKLKRFVLWVCDSAAEIYPHKSDTANNHYFEWLAFLVGPPVSCPCGCDPALCTAWNARQSEKNLKCPYAGECVTMLSAAWYDSPGPKHVAAKLGLDLNDARSPFTSPDGSVLQTDICAIWLPGVIPFPVLVTESRITKRPAAGGQGITIFNGGKAKANPNLKNPKGPVVSPDLHTGHKGRTLGLPPPKFRHVRYVGPNACATLDGCIPD
jgi:hypothetical protein